MSIPSVMTHRVVTVHMDDSLAVVREIFEASGFHHLLVVEEDKLVGVISDRDYLKAISPFIDSISERIRDRATLERKVHQIMTREVITLKATDSMVKAIELFNTHKISCLPVIDENEKPIGIVSWRDIFRYFGASVQKRRS
ncbi:CBS domain-containing protein [Alteromonas lipolytica]|uniref:CBS domain-containing protein n=1 Tax=Alteromonas lipolytica TaxID=1856405 RepID=A0A1E8FF50_9ALTE|nr:CBS domain-containing protein [Alteromonas lipolytica]OFI34396.1 CBS domain-containing protein [Alteromonas lipolytica]GGF81822.1 CBS domain-containing protein [Alteromonas lipolytica]